MNDSKWFDPHQPQMLQIATMLLYFNAVLALFTGPVGLLYAAASASAAYGMANSKRWAYVLAVVISVLRLLFVIAAFGGVFDTIRFGLLAVIFPAAQVALLLHPQSRAHQKIWYS